MHLKTLICASLVAAFASSAYAEDLTATLALEPNGSIDGAFSGAWGATHLAAGTFTDTFTFTGPTEGFFDSAIITIGYSPSTTIDFTSLSLNGQEYDLVDAGAYAVATLSPVSLSGPFVLTVNGISAPSVTSGVPTAASYAGVMNVSPIPEAQTWAMMLAGLGVLGSLARRRLGR